MATVTKVKVTYRQGAAALAQLQRGIAFPEKLGKEEYDPAQRAFANEELQALRKVLLSYSAAWAKRRETLFGPDINNWRRKNTQDGEDTWALVDAQAEVEMALGEDAERGLYWLCLLAMHPASPFLTGVADHADVWWPFAEAIGYRRDLQEVTGLNQRKAPRLPKRDSDPVWGKSETKKAAELPANADIPHLEEVAKA